MPKRATRSGSGDEAALQLLEGAEPASLPHDQLLAAIEALGGETSPVAADILVRITQPKDVAKAARRALFRLQTRGIQPAADRPSQAAPEQRREAPKMTLLEASVSSYDPRGTRAVSILAEKPFTGLVSMFAIASDTEGLLDAELTTTTKKAFRARLDNFSRQYAYIEFAPLPADYANQIIHRSAVRNEHSGRALPQDFSMWKSFGAEAPDPPLAPPIFAELPADDVRQRIPVEDTKELARTEFEAWAYEEGQLKEYLVRLDTARGGPLVLSEDAQQGREKAIVDEATDAIFQGEERDRAKERLIETAHFLFKQGKLQEAERCFRAGLSIDDVEPHEQPFLREIVTRSMRELSHADHDHEHEHQHGTERQQAPAPRTESGIILPT